MKTCNSFLLAVILLLHTSCHSSKNVASTDTADANTIATSDIRVSSSKLDSAFSSMAIKLDSFDIDAEPVVLIKRDSTRSAVVAYRYHIKANSGTINTQRNAVSRSVGDTLRQYYTAMPFDAFGSRAIQCCSALTLQVRGVVDMLSSNTLCLVCNLFALSPALIPL